MEIALIEKFFRQDQYSSLDRRFASFIYELDGKNSPELFLAAGLLSAEVFQGHARLELTEVADKDFVWEDDKETLSFKTPPPGEWADKLRKSPTVGKEGSRTPLIMPEIGEKCLYFWRYWNYELRLAEYIKKKLSLPDRPVDREDMEKTLDLTDAIFSRKDESQRLAAAIAFKRDFCVISGGPGTGKTSAVIKALVLLLKRNPDLKIALAAPTGKAAARLKESVSRSKNALKSISPALAGILDKIPEDAGTIHRLLGARGNSPYFRHNRANPLPWDLVIADEASMVDLALMSKLTEALKKDAGLIIVGDRSQLFSVEAGTVLGDICALADLPKTDGYPPKFMAELENSHRFKRDEGIGKLSSLVRQGLGKESLELSLDESSSDIGWRRIPPPGGLKQYLKNRLLPVYSRYFQAQSPREAFQFLESFMILCAFRNGPYGTININNLLERIILEEGIAGRTEAEWRPGKPVMITKNNYDLKLFNGDIGVCGEQSQSRPKVYFPESEDEYRERPPGGLPEHETAFAITVHKSQGSEFKKVILILGDQDSPLLSRELIYTGLTRARESVEIWGEESVFIQAATRQTRRSSGLTNNFAAGGFETLKPE